MENVKDYLNNLINEKYNTDKGYGYFYDVIKENYPNFKINKDNLENISFEEISKKEYEESGIAAFYNVRENKIRVFIDDENIDKDAVINSFAHELIHLFTSDIDKTGVIHEGINEKLPDGRISPFLAVNEGITQMLANEISDYELKDAYPFETNISKELAVIIGKEKLLEIYSSRNCENFMNELCSFNNPIDVQDFLIKTFSFHEIYNYTRVVDIYGEESFFGTIIQKHLMDFYNNSNVCEDEKFKKLFMSWDKVLELAPEYKGGLYEPRNLMFAGIENLTFSPNDKKTSL